MSFWVYVLRCADGSYYAGHTDDLERRVGEHAAGACGGYTATRLPVALAWSQPCATREEALAAERRIKGWSRAKKEAMMRGDWAEVSRLARSRSAAGEQTVRGELVERSSVRGEPVEPRTDAPTRPSTGSGRTEVGGVSGRTEVGGVSGRAEVGGVSGRAEVGGVSGRAGEGAAHSVRPELVEGRDEPRGCP